MKRKLFVMRSSSISTFFYTKLYMGNFEQSVILQLLLQHLAAFLWFNNFITTGCSLWVEYLVNALPFPSRFFCHWTILQGTSWAQYAGSCKQSYEKEHKATRKYFNHSENKMIINVPSVKVSPNTTYWSINLQGCVHSARNGKKNKLKRGGLTCPLLQMYFHCVPVKWSKTCTKLYPC